MRRMGWVWGSLGLVVGVVVGAAGPAAAEPDCGKAVQGAPAGTTVVKADLTPLEADQVVNLGRSTGGNRLWEVDFTWTAECALREPDVKPVLQTLQGSESSVDGKVILLSSVVDGDARRVVVTLHIPRDPKKIPSGQFKGVLRVGSGAAGVGEATVTIRHQEPLTVNSMSGRLQAAWIVVGLAGAVLLFGAERLVGIVRNRGAHTTEKADRNSQDFTTPLAVVVGALAMYPLLARLGGAKTVPWPAWPVWLGAAGLLGGVVVGVLKHRDSSAAVALVGGQRFATALLLSFGAGIAAWQAQYLRSPDWALTVESALSLVGVVGGATATSALLFLSPNPDKTEAAKGPPKADGTEGQNVTEPVVTTNGKTPLAEKVPAKPVLAGKAGPPG